VRPGCGPASKDVSALVVDPHGFDLEVASQLADATISLRLVLTKRVGDEKAQLHHCWRIVTPPVQEAVKEPLRRRSNKGSDLLAIWFGQLR
jgi:hypothetical protein